MKKFRFKAKDRNRESKYLTGMVEAVDESQAVGILRERGMLVIKLWESKSGLVGGIIAGITKRVTLSEIATFTRQLSTMTTAGLQITESLTILRNQSKPVLSEVISSILLDVQGGSSLAAAMVKHPAVFTKVYVALVKSGEAAGVLDEVLARLADNLERQREFQLKIKSAMVYPAIVVLGMIGVSFLVMVMVMPKLTALFVDFGAELPLPTKILISVSNLTSKLWWVELIGAAAVFQFYRLSMRTRLGRLKMDEFKLKIPIVGKLSKQIILTEVSRTLSLLVATGISIIDALEVVSGATGNVVYEQSLKDAARQVEKGFPLAFALASDSIYPQIVPQMVSVGEETGKLDEVLSKLAKYFEVESDQAVRGLTSAIEPVMIIGLGIGVMFLVVAVILPIYNLTAQF